MKPTWLVVVAFGLIGAGVVAALTGIAGGGAAALLVGVSMGAALGATGATVLAILRRRRSTGERLDALAEHLGGLRAR